VSPLTPRILSLAPAAHTCRQTRARDSCIRGWLLKDPAPSLVHCRGLLWVRRAVLPRQPSNAAAREPADPGQLFCLRDAWPRARPQGRLEGGAQLFREGLRALRGRRRCPTPASPRRVRPRDSCSLPGRFYMDAPGVKRRRRQAASEAPRSWRPIAPSSRGYSDRQASPSLRACSAGSPAVCPSRACARPA
jgi:hypothetical protein